MSIQGLGNTQARAESRPASGRAQTAGASFQDRLLQTAAQAASAPAVPAKNSLLSSLFDLKKTMVERMRVNKEKTEEQQSWEKLMKYLDAWIESLQEEGADIGKSARAYAALQEDLTRDKSDRPDLADRLLEHLTASLGI